MPELGVGQAAFEAGHAGQADAVSGFPVGLPGGVVGYACAFEKFRRLWVHAFGDGTRGYAWQAVTDRAVLFVDVGACQEVGLVGRHGRVGLFLLRQVSIQGGVRELSFEHQGRIGHRDWGEAC